jgi:hypothetical protein
MCVLDCSRINVVEKSGNITPEKIYDFHLNNKNE